MIDVQSMTREACLNDPVLLAMLVASNIAIAAAYVWIPVSIAWVLTRSPKVPFPAVWWLSFSFILSCGLTHACAALVFFRPAWHLETALCVATAVVSLSAAIILHRGRRPILAALRDYFDLADRMASAVQP